MENELVSILIPVYNRVTLVGETIDSAINQIYKNIEIIIVDNCSTDGTWELINSYAAKDTRIRIFQNEENIGPVKNWKRCIDEAKGEYAKILFSDDLMAENFIEETVKVFDTETAFILAPYNIFNTENVRNVSLYGEGSIYLTINEYLSDILLLNKWKYAVSPTAALFRLQDLKLSFLLDIPNDNQLDFNRYGAGNDLLFFCLTAIRYKTIKICNSTSVSFRYHKNSFTISNDLSLYYSWAEFYFISNYQKELTRKFSSIIRLRAMKHPQLFRLKNNHLKEYSKGYLVYVIFWKLFSYVRELIVKK